MFNTPVVILLRHAAKAAKTPKWDDGATPIVERDETFLEAVEEFVSNVVN